MQAMFQNEKLLTREERMALLNALVAWRTQRKDAGKACVFEDPAEISAVVYRTVPSGEANGNG